MQKTLHAKNLETLLEKVTMNNRLDFCQLNFAAGRVSTSVISHSRDIVIKHNLENNVIRGLGENEELSLNFVEPQSRIIPQMKALESIDVEETEIEITDEKMRILAGQWGGGTIHFCDETVLANNIMHRDPRELDYFHQIQVTPELHYGFKPIKMVAPGYGKIYFTVERGTLLLETGDKTNRFTDNYKLPLSSPMETINVDDLTVCFDFQNITGLMNVMAAEENKTYIMNFAWNQNDERGMMYVHTQETDEKYYLFSRAN